MPINLIISGVGGQGNVLASQILGRAAVRQGFRVTIGETFGLSQRGGPVMSHVRLSKTEAYGPIIPPNRAHFILGLEPLETLRIAPEYAQSSTVFLVNSRPIYPLNVIAGDVEYPDPQWIREKLENQAQELYWLEGTTAAIELGGPIMLNMVMLGALCELQDFPVSSEHLKEILGAVIPPGKLESNCRALDRGGQLIRELSD